MRHQRRPSYPTKGEREQFKHHLLPYPGKSYRGNQNKGCENYPEFLLCIPVKPASSVLGCELDIFVRLVSVISIGIWLSLLLFEGFYFYTEVIGAQTVVFVVISIILGSLLVIFGIFCGVLGYIGCTISNSRCIHFFFLHLNFQLIINTYALIASVIRGYIVYSCAYILYISLVCFSLYPSWSLYVHVKINGIPPNVYKHYGLLSDILHKTEQKYEKRSNMEDSESMVGNACSSISNSPDLSASIHINSKIFQKKEQTRLTMLKQKSSTKESVINANSNNSEDYSYKLSRTIVKFSDENDETQGICTEVQTNRTPCTSVSNQSQPPLNSYIIPQPSTPSSASYKLRGKAKILLNWSKPSISVNRNIATSSNTDYSNRNLDTPTPQYNKIQTINHDYQPKFSRMGVL
ncbi:transmembrane domain-containing protein [Cryptosporidium canis]|uniref:Transmembrane domain-containing protein n=1 Tax=Cryptosporidium canis TaxID=195482 RepID=A0A9D5DFX1_9CRYT|nr:transmembrane domain-containing protein [Cryptosporidium canis]